MVASFSNDGNLIASMTASAFSSEGKKRLHFIPFKKTNLKCWIFYYGKA